MFRTKLSVDRHVQELFRKVKDENERTLRCYNIAKLYFHVEDYESARRYVSSYLEVKGDQAGPHKLLGQIYEALGQKEPALSQYKQSLELEPRQDDLVLKVCEILVDMDITNDVNRVKYWVERAEERFPHHPTVFQLKEKLLSVDKSNSSSEDLEALIAAELSARPSDVHLRVKLLKYYTDRNRLEEAYKHAVEVESTYAHRDSVVWSEALCDLLTKCKEGRQSQWTFWILYVSSLERHAALALKEQGHGVKKSIAEAAQAVFNLDQALTEAKLQNFLNNGAVAEQMFAHMWGQLHYHLACLLLRKTKREQGSWSDTGRLCAPLLLAAMHVQPIDPTATWAQSLKEQTKSQLQLWQREGSFRCSQAGHVLQNYARDDVKRMMEKIDKLCIGSWRERIYQRIFVSKAHIATSYFANHNAPNPPLRLCSATEMKLYDEVAEHVWPASLHHHVWLGIANNRSTNRTNSYEESGPRPHQYCHVFPALQLSAFNLSQAAPDTLGQLDIDAFLNAAVLCASVVVEEQQRSGFLSPDRLPTLPADITNTLCTCNQEKWWSLAYKIYRKHDDAPNDLAEIRQELQRGLEVVRCIGNHGLHPVILVHLARIFHYRAKLLKEKDKNHADLPFLEARCELYWSTVVPLLERLLNNQAIRTTSTKLFDYQGKEMNNLELSNALEEGRLLLAQRYIRDKQHEEAIEALQALKCPEASFMQGEIYKSLADELMSNLPKESLTSAMRSQHIVMLSKARGCYYLTLDRLRSPGMNPKHPLNSELGTRIADIENDLKRIDPDVWQGDSNRHECDVMSEESYSSAHSGDQPIIQNSFTGGLSSTIQTGGTPQKSSAHRTPKQASTPCRIQHQDIRELTRKSAQQEARPSPERLDAQIRQLIHSKNNMIQTILEQNKALLETNKSLVESSKKMNEKIEELQRQFANFCKDSPPQPRQNPVRTVSTGQNNIDDDLYLLGEEDFADLSYTQPQHQSTAQQTQIQANLFLQQQQQQQPRNPYAPLVYPQPLQAYYPPAMPFNDPHASHLSSLYGGPRVFQMPPFYPRPSLDPSLAALPKMPENMQGLFTNRLMNQMGDMFGPAPVPQPQQQQQQQQPIPTPPQPGPAMPIAAPQLSMRLQSLETPRNEIPAKDVAAPGGPAQASKETSNARQPPVNVVITTSDTLPTSAPAVQPTLSVTIPAQYRAASSTNQVAAPVASAPHSYQISMPSHAMIPTTVNLPPLSTTITNTISATVAEQEKNQMKNNSVLSTSANNYSGDSSVEVEHDPLPDFVPVIPLPAEVQVTTGEENEVSLFCARAKLYRWADQEWKERGVGNVKLLKNSEGKVRLVMRREQVLKICANHMLTRDMELTKMTKNDRAWIWVANDFADEQVRLEKLCIKFKTSDEAVSFKEIFDKAKASQEQLETKTPQVSPEKTDDPRPAKPENTKTNLGGFTFTSEPIIQKIADPVAGKKEEPTKPSPFADFTFTKSSNTESTGFSFLKAAPTPVTPEAKSILRRPHAPSPGELAEMGAAEIARGTLDESGEASLLEKRTTLMRFSGDAWKSRGPATVKILIDPKTGKIRLCIKREKMEKAPCNYVLSGKCNFSLLPENDNGVSWNALESSKGKTEMVACIFDSAELAKQFLDFANSLTKIMDDDHVPTSSIRLEGKIVVIYGAKRKTSMEKPSLSEIFKPPSDSWECNDCYTRNDSSARKCIACEADRLRTPAQAAPANDSGEKPDLWNQFKPQADSWECQSCYIRNSKENVYCVACDTAKDPTMPPKPKTGGFNLQEASKETFTFGIPPKSSEKPLAEMFKPPAGSWACPGCYVQNNESTLHCVSCETPKDPSVPPKSKVTFEPPKTSTFSFGIPQASATTNPGTGFTFKMPTQDDKAAAAAVFGGPPKITSFSSNFSFGIPARPSTPPNNESSGGFTFGSPGKSFDFQFSSKSAAKSPGDSNAKGETSEDEVAESDDIYFAPVIPLPDKIEVKTGEEDEEIVYSHRAKLFRFDSGAKEWKERGLGDIKILRNPQTQKLRMVMRREQTLKLCLNHAIAKDIELRAKDEKTWLWNAPDYSDGDIEYLQLACRFKNSQIAQEFHKNLSDALEASSQSSSESTEKAEPTTKPETSPIHDIEVVYEAKASDEDKAAALKLQLPENFYAYKLKDDCPGCRGCQEPEMPIFDKIKTSTQSPIVAKIAPPKFTGCSNRNSSESSESTPKPILHFGQSAAMAEETKNSSNFLFGAGAANGMANIFSGSPNTQSAKNTPATNLFSVENLSICSPSTNQQTSQNSSEQTSSPQQQQQQQQQQPFGRIASPFGSTNLTGQTSVFGAFPNTGTSLFGGTATRTTPEAPKEPETGLSFQSVFGSSTKSWVNRATPVFGAEPTTPGGQNSTGSLDNSIFGGGGKSAVHVFGGAPKTHIFGKTPTDPESLSGGFSSASSEQVAKESNAENTENNDKSDVTTYLPFTSSLTFETLASQTPANTFKKDPNFLFAGAGATVFGGKASSLTSPESKNSAKKGEAAEEEEGGEEEAEETEHDPHFEPIIPLPDAIEVRTGEEDEDKIFGERAKLYRYESETKEWKERGTGEMKLLYHPEHGSYRLLLRREQVHKVVCNQLVTLDLELRPLHSSDRAWMWAAFNHAEEPCALEELAVKFKNPDLANQFKDAVEKAKNELRGRQTNNEQARLNETDNTEGYEDDHEDEDVEDEDDDESSVFFSSPADLLTLENNEWKPVGTGTLKILYDSDIYGAKIVVEADNTGEIFSSTVISEQTSMTINENCGVWTAIDEIPNPPIRRSLKAVFESAELAQSMYISFQEGQECAKEVGISETPYYDPIIE